MVAGIVRACRSIDEQLFSTQSAHDRLAGTFTPEVTVLVIDDGSDDDTARAAREAGAEVFSHGRNRGVGQAFHAIVEHAAAHDYDILVTIDADGQFDPSDIPALVRPICSARPGADIVTCSRFLNPELIPEDMPFMKRFGNRWMARVISFLTGQRVTDAACGFRAYSREAFLRLNLFGTFTYTQETLLDLSYKGFVIHEVPLKVRGKREHGMSHISSNLFRYAYHTLKIILKTVRDYKPLKFFGTFGFLTFAVGIVLELFPFYRFFTTGGFTPYKYLAFLGGGFVMLGVIIVVVGFVADMMKRVRLTQEEILYYEKKRNAK